MPSEVKWAISFLAGAVLLFIGWKVYFVLVTLHVLICLLLIAVILLQSGEAADLAGAFGGSGSQTAFGPRGAATILSQATTWCAIMFMVCALTMVVKVDRGLGTVGGSSVLEKVSKPAPKTVPVPTPGQVTPAPVVPQSTAPAPSQPAPAAPTKP